MVGAGMGAGFEGREGPRWRVETGSLGVVVRLGSGGLGIETVVDRGTGLEWELDGQRAWTYLTVDGKRSIDGEWGVRSWEFVEDARRRSGVLRVELAVKVGEVRIGIRESIWVADDVPALRRWVEVRNEGEETIEIGRYHLIDLAIGHDLVEEGLRLFAVEAFAGHRRDRWEPGDANFGTREWALGPSEAVRLDVGAYRQYCSWLAVGRGDGGGLVVGLEYDGAAEVRVFDVGRSADGATWRAAGGVSDGVRLAAEPTEGVNVRLEPGEEWRSPAAFMSMFSGDWDGAAQVTHALVERHLAPAWPDGRFPYVMFNSWGFAFDLRPEELRRCLDVAAEVGVEVFVADYGWARDVGDWVSVGERMPPLGELGELVRERGMKLGAWMGFANAGPTTPVLAEHPEWRAYPDDWGSFQSRALCLAEPAVRDWVAAEAIRVVGEYGIDYLVHDFELITPCTHPEHGHPPDPGGYHSAVGYHEVLRRLRAAYPGLVVENCQGGGRLMTYAMVADHDTSITSDGPVLRDALARRQTLYGASYPFPLRFCDNYMEEPPTDYACHSSMIGGPWILMDKLTEWGEAEIASAKRNVALYKEIRPLFRDGRVFHLRRPDGVGWDGLQVQREAGDGVVFLFQPAREGEVVVRLKGLDDRRRYWLRVGGTGEKWEMDGEVLMRDGMRRVMEAGGSDVILVNEVV